ncbi:MAG: hypothetical protein WA949_01930 [Phormidesmis sp.]
MRVADLTVDELTKLIRETVAETIQFMMVDPDEGLLLKPEVEQRLRKALEEAKSGKQKGIPLAEVAEKLGIDWE